MCVHLKAGAEETDVQRRHAGEAAGSSDHFEEKEIITVIHLTFSSLFLSEERETSSKGSMSNKFKYYCHHSASKDRTDTKFSLEIRSNA